MPQARSRHAALKRGKTGELSRVAMAKQVAAVWEEAMNTPECYTVMVAFASCLTIIGMIAVGVW